MLEENEVNIHNTPLDAFDPPMEEVDDNEAEEVRRTCLMLFN
jgi:hypothetical protein